MCLSKINKKVKRLRPGTGYKFIERNTAYTSSQYKNAINASTEVYVTGQWYCCEEPHRSIKDRHIAYPMGFHIFQTKRAAKKKGTWEFRAAVLCKVEFLYVVAEGIDRGEKTIVAQMIRIVEELV